MKRAIISFANHKGRYIKGLARLSESLRTNFDGDFLGFVNEVTLGAPLHTDVPYAFKVYAFKKAFEAGYDQVLWLDTSVYAVKNVQPIFDIISEQGYFFQEAGHLLGEWSNDKLLNYFNLTRDEAMDIPMVMGGIIGLNKNCFVLDALNICMQEGLFNGRWINNSLTESEDTRCQGHRHEMSCLSAICHKNNIKWSEQINQYGGYFDETKENTIFKLQGM